MTTFEPGASEVFTQGWMERPFSTARLATNPAATKTEGLEVLVQLVMAAMTTAPSCMVSLWLLTESSADLGSAPSEVRKFCFTSGRLMRSCGRLGPAREGTTEARSSSSVSLYTGSGTLTSRNRPCSLAYASTRAMVEEGRLVMRR